MVRTIQGIWVGGTLLAAASGCLSPQVLENPLTVQECQKCADVENPVLVSPGLPTAVSYAELFEKVYGILDDYYEIPPGYANRYEGRIVTLPRIAPGFEQPWRVGNPDPYERLRATFQTVRKTATAEIRAAERGGYQVLVTVEQEVEDLPRPLRATLGSAAFNDLPSVDRVVEVVGPDGQSQGRWYRIGRDLAAEQQILRRIRQCY